MSSLDRLWPVADLPRSPKPEVLESLSREHASATGLSVEGWSCASQLVVDEAALSWLERTRTRGGQGPPALRFRDGVDIG